MTRHHIAGRPVELPVQIRDATVASVMFPVPAARAREIIAYSTLEPLHMAGRAVCALACAEYLDGDLGQYHEFAVAFLVHSPHGHGIGAFIHWLPVDQMFTLKAGREIWGFPKQQAEIELSLHTRIKHCSVQASGRRVIDLAIAPGLPVPSRPLSLTLGAYSCLRDGDAVLRRIPWTIRPAGVRTRPGGARVRLGDHPIADELRQLGLDHATPLASTTITRLAMTFGAATP
jgi:acetoacetate decarboxylase